MLIGMGTDSGVSVAWTTHTEIRDMAGCGLTPREAIESATRVNAEILGLDDLGTVAEGKSASFVVLDAEPAGRHHQHAADRQRLSAWRAGGPRGAAREVHRRRAAIATGAGGAAPAPRCARPATSVRRFDHADGGSDRDRGRGKDSIASCSKTGRRSASWGRPKPSATSSRPAATCGVCATAWIRRSRGPGPMPSGGESSVAARVGKSGRPARSSTRPYARATRPGASGRSS